MRILGFNQKWPKLKNPTFTTFRFPRKDKDWEVGEVVRVVYLPRSPKREVLGTAEIIGRELRDTPHFFFPSHLSVNEAEVKEDGFRDLLEMQEFFVATYGKDRLLSPINKLTLKWLERKEEND